MEIKRSCRICKQPYQPHPRNAKRNKTWGQKTCGKRECRLAWRRKRWQCWAKLHPGHIKNDARRAKVRAWAKAYPDYCEATAPPIRNMLRVTDGGASRPKSELNGPQNKRRYGKLSSRNYRRSIN